MLLPCIAYMACYVSCIIYTYIYNCIYMCFYSCTYCCIGIIIYCVIQLYLMLYRHQYLQMYLMLYRYRYNTHTLMGLRYRGKHARGMQRNRYANYLVLLCRDKKSVPVEQFEQPDYSQPLSHMQPRSKAIDRPTTESRAISTRTKAAQPGTGPPEALISH